MSRRLVVAIGAGVVLLGCVDRKVAGSGTSGGFETSGGSGGSGSGGSSQGLEPTGGGTTSGTGGGTSEGAGSDTTGATTVDTGCGGGEFVIHPDGGGSAIECDPYQQNCGPCGKCVAYAEGGGASFNATKCVAVTGANKPGEPCMAEGGGVSGMDDCEKGAMCWNVNNDSMGTCFALCTESGGVPVCDSGSVCYNPSIVLNLCFPTCDPLLQDCDGGALCIPSGDYFVCVLDASGDAGAVNDPCQVANSCDKGLVCLNTSSASSACNQGSTGCCQPFCDFSMVEACPNPDQKCVQWFDPMMPIPPGYEDVGVCMISL